jgi:hypothetical protein
MALHVEDHSRLDSDGRMRSLQRLVLSEPHRPVAQSQAEAAAQGYFSHIAQTFQPVLRVKSLPDGSIGICLAGAMLLCLGPPSIAAQGSGWAVRHPIVGGLFVRTTRHHHGWLEFQVQPSTLAVIVEGYYPRLAGNGQSAVLRGLYLRTQSALHVWLTSRYLRRLAESLHQ